MFCVQTIAEYSIDVQLRGP